MKLDTAVGDKVESDRWLERRAFEEGEEEERGSHRLVRSVAMQIKWYLQGIDACRPSCRVKTR